MICAACHRETNPYGEFTPRGVINRCGHEDCRRPVDGGVLPAVANVDFKQRSPFPELANAAPSQVVQEAPPAPPRLPQPKPAREARTSEARPLDAQLPELRARLAHVKATLADMAALQREEATLERMLAAAEEPVN